MKRKIKKQNTSKKSKENISIEVVKRVSSIAKLNLTTTELKKIQKDLNDILTAFRELDKANTKNTEPSFHPLALGDVFREDKIDECLSQEKALSNTKYKERGYFKGPRAV